MDTSGLWQQRAALGIDDSAGKIAKRKAAEEPHYFSPDT